MKDSNLQTPIWLQTDSSKRQFVELNDFYHWEYIDEVLSEIFSLNNHFMKDYELRIYLDESVNSKILEQIIKSINAFHITENKIFDLGAR